MNTTTDKNSPVIYPDKCTSCMLCILACAYHHSKKFDRKSASIEVNVFKKEREINIVVHRVKTNERHACDYCEGESEPLCVKYCIPKAINFSGGSLNENHRRNNITS